MENREEMSPLPQKAQHVLSKCDLQAIWKFPPGIQSWEGPTHQLSSSFCFLFCSSHFSVFIIVSPALAWEMSTLINGLKDDLVSLQHLSLRISGFFYEIQFGKLLYQSTKPKKQIWWEKYSLFLRVVGKNSVGISWYTYPHKVTPLVKARKLKWNTEKSFRECEFSIWFDLIFLKICMNPFPAVLM